MDNRYIQRPSSILDLGTKRGPRMARGRPKKLWKDEDGVWWCWKRPIRQPWRKAHYRRLSYTKKPKMHVQGSWHPSDTPGQRWRIAWAWEPRKCPTCDGIKYSLRLLTQICWRGPGGWVVRSKQIKKGEFRKPEALRKPPRKPLECSCMRYGPKVGQQWVPTPEKVAPGPSVPPEPIFPGNRGNMIVVEPVPFPTMRFIK